VALAAPGLSSCSHATQHEEILANKGKAQYRYIIFDFENNYEQVVVSKTGEEAQGKTPKEEYEDFLSVWTTPNLSKFGCVRYAITRRKLVPCILRLSFFISVYHNLKQRSRDVSDLDYLLVCSNADKLLFQYHKNDGTNQSRMIAVKLWR